LRAISRFSHRAPTPEPLICKVFRYVPGFRKSGTIEPANGVADFEAGVFDGAGEAVVGAGAAEGEEVAAGLQDA
jgi:hypothetical protein